MGGWAFLLCEGQQPYRCPVLGVHSDPTHSDTWDGGNKSCRVAGDQTPLSATRKASPSGGNLRARQEEEGRASSELGQRDETAQRSTRRHRGNDFGGSGGSPGRSVSLRLCPSNKTRTPSQLGGQTARGFPASPGEGSPAPPDLPRQRANSSRQPDVRW